MLQNKLLNEEVNRTEPSPSVSVPWLKVFYRYKQSYLKAGLLSLQVRLEEHNKLFKLEHKFL
jgi:hypothetical protein